MNTKTVLDIYSVMNNSHFFNKENLDKFIDVHSIDLKTELNKLDLLDNLSLNEKLAIIVIDYIEPNSIGLGNTLVYMEKEQKLKKQEYNYGLVRLAINNIFTESMINKQGEQKLERVTSHKNNLFYLLDHCIGINRELNNRCTIKNGDNFYRISYNNQIIEINTKGLSEIIVDNILDIKPDEASYYLDSYKCKNYITIELLDLHFKKLALHKELKNSILINYTTTIT